MKCVITGNETNTMTNNVPVSAEGRELLSKVHEAYNNKIKEEFIDRALGVARDEEAKTDTEARDEDVLRQAFSQMAPQVSRNKMLELLKIGVKDAVETLNEVKNDRQETDV